MTTKIKNNPAKPGDKSKHSKTTISSQKTMKGLVYGGLGKIELKELPKPGIEKSTAALVKIIKTTICGTDLGNLHGKTPSCNPGVLGQEGFGLIEEVGANE